MPTTQKPPPILRYTLVQEQKPMFKPKLQAIPEKEVFAEHKNTVSQQLLDTIIRHTDHHKNYYSIQIIRLMVNVLFFFLLGVKQQPKPRNLFINYSIKNKLQPHRGCKL
jgi:hypothetical protein